LELLRSAVIRVALAAAALVALPAAAAPGAFTLTGGPTCSVFSPGIVFLWSPSSGATSYELIRDDGQHTGLPVSPFVFDINYFYYNVLPDGPARSYFVRAGDGTATTDSNTITVTPPATGCVPRPDPIGIIGRAICDPGTPQRVMSPGVELEWHFARLATSYDLYRDGAFSTSFRGGGDAYTDYVAFDSGGFTTSYYVVAKNSAGTSTSNTVEIIVPADICVTAPPLVPVLSGSATCNTTSHVPSVALSWTAVRSFYGFQVFRNGVPYALSQLGISYSDTNVEPGHTYTYNVVANALSASLSNTVTVTIPNSVCTPPGAFTLTATTGCSPPVTLAWTASTNNVLGYSIFREQLFMATVGSNVLTYADDSAQMNTSYRYFVRANGSGVASDSNAVTVKTDPALCEVHLPDLVALDINPSTMDARAGDTIAVEFDVMNGGNALALPATARIRFGKGPSMSPSDSLLGTITLPVLGSGAAIQSTVSVTLPSVAAGTYRLFVSLDEEHTSGDAHFDDNVKASGTISLTDMIPPKRRAATH